MKVYFFDFNFSQFLKVLKYDLSPNVKIIENKRISGLATENNIKQISAISETNNKYQNAISMPFETKLRLFTIASPSPKP